MEMTPDRYRTIIGFSVQVLKYSNQLNLMFIYYIIIILQIFFAFGIMAVACWAYIIPDWSIIQIIYGLHSSLLLLHWWYTI